MHTSPISPVAAKLVTNLLAGLIARRETATSDLRLACNWLFGAHLLASAIGDPKAMALLNTAEVELRNVSRPLNSGRYAGISDSISSPCPVSAFGLPRRSIAFSSSSMALAIATRSSGVKSFRISFSACSIADRYGDELEVLAWLGTLLERITCQGQEGAHD